MRTWTKPATVSLKARELSTYIRAAARSSGMCISRLTR